MQVDWVSTTQINVAPKSDYLDKLAFRIKIQEYPFHGSEEDNTSEYEQNEPSTSKWKKKNATLPLRSDHLRRKQNLYLPEIPQTV